MKKFLFPVGLGSCYSPTDGVLFQCFIGAIVITLLGLAPALYIQNLTDFALPTGNEPLLNLLSFAMVVLLIFQVTIVVERAMMRLLVLLSYDTELW